MLIVVSFWAFRFMGVVWLLENLPKARSLKVAKSSNKQDLSGFSAFENI
jgi:hypothetical protein